MERKLVIGLAGVVVAVAMLLCSNAYAGGGQHYPNGAEGIFCGACPPPGWYVVDYLYYYNADKYMDDDGDEYTAGPFADIDVTVWAEVVRVLYSSEYEILGGNWLAHIFLIYLDADIESPGLTAAGIKSEDSGLYDVIISPFILAWHMPPYHYVGAIDIYVPVGDYEKGNIASVGKNFWTFEPIFGISAIYENGWSWSGKFMFDINMTNDEYVAPGTTAEVELDPGMEFHFDYSVDYAVAKDWRVGLAGYFYTQVTDDEIDGVEQDEKGRVFSIGPAVKYDYKNMSFEGRAEFEMAAKNRPEGQAYWFKFIYAF